MPVSAWFNNLLSLIIRAKDAERQRSGHVFTMFIYKQNVRVL